MAFVPVSEYEGFQGIGVPHKSSDYLRYYFINEKGEVKFWNPTIGESVGDGTYVDKDQILAEGKPFKFEGGKMVFGEQIEVKLPEKKKKLKLKKGKQTYETEATSVTIHVNHIKKDIVYLQMNQMLCQKADLKELAEFLLLLCQADWD